MWLAKSISDLRPDVFFLTYDEPRKEALWQEFRQLVPWAKRVDGVKGFDAAHKECARVATTSRFFVVDGDNRVLPQMLKVKVSKLWDFSDVVNSWPARNAINGLIYGNGGIKNWPRQLALTLRSHENAEVEEMKTDFYYGVTYRHFPETLSVAEVGATPYQAFRAGLREGFKMSLVEGRRIQITNATNPQEVFRQALAKPNLERLKIWCSVGSDHENGLWSLYGARLGCLKSLDGSWPLENIFDYNCLGDYWSSQVLPGFHGSDRRCPISGVRWSRSRLYSGIQELGQRLFADAGLEVVCLKPEESKFFKSVYISRPRPNIGNPRWNSLLKKAAVKHEQAPSQTGEIVRERSRGVITRWSLWN